MFTALITGASGGLGEAFVRILSDYPSCLIITGRNRKKLLELQKKYARSGSVEIIPIVCDLSKPEGVFELMAFIKKRDLIVDFLINNAGFGLSGEFVSQSSAEITDLLEVDIQSVVLLCRLLLPGMLERRRGGILNVSSIASCLPGPGMNLYYASKAFVTSFSRALHQELKNSRIHVCALCPGPISTGFEKAAGLNGAVMFSILPVSRPETIARAGLTALARNRTVCYPDIGAKFVYAASRFLPVCSLEKAASWINEPGQIKKR